MMKKIFVLFCIGFVWIIPGSMMAEKMTDNWRLAGYTKYRDAVFVDKDRLVSPAPGIRAAWIKIAPSSKSAYSRLIHEYLSAVKKSGKRFKSVEILCEISCSGHRIRFTRFVYLETDRKLIHESTETRPEWMQIVQGSLWYQVEKEACTEVNRN